MSLLDFFLSKKKTPANIAKERLQIIVAENRSNNYTPSYLTELKRDILHVICKYIQIEPDMLKVQFEQKNNDIFVLKLNMTLPDINKRK